MIVRLKKNGLYVKYDIKESSKLWKALFADIKKDLNGDKDKTNVWGNF